MSNMKFTLNFKGVGELLKSDEMTSVLEGYARSISARAGDDYEARIMPTRVIVRPKNEKGEKDNADNNTLLKSMR